MWGRSLGGQQIPVPQMKQSLGLIERYKSQGIVFVREPKKELYGTVAVFKDLYGNLWDLIERTSHIEK